MPPRPHSLAAPLAADYAARVSSGAISDDPAQRALVAVLDRLIGDLAARQSAGFFSRLTGRATVPNGLYIHGEVGRGKTMLMDAFFAAAPVAAKRRIHFNEFMGEI